MARPARVAGGAASLDRPAQHGIDVFLLMKTSAGWRIVSIVNEIVRPGVDLPEEIRQ